MNNNKKRENYTKWHAVAGMVAGFSPEFLLYPLDLVKNRRQVQNGLNSNHPHHYRNLRHGIHTIINTHGYIGLYRGISTSILAEGIAWGLYFGIYNQFKRMAKLETKSNELKAYQHLGCAAGAGTITVLCTNPLWITKTRLQLQTHVIGTSVNTDAYRGTFDCLRRIVNEEGFTALYRGLVPALSLVSHGAIQFMIYEECRKRIVYQTYNNNNNNNNQNSYDDSKVAGWKFMACGGVSKLTASMITYPLQVIKARLYQSGKSFASAYSKHYLPDKHQNNFKQRAGAKYHSLQHVILHTFETEGMRGFYKGLPIQLLKTGPASSITFGVYELLIRYLIKPVEDDIE